MCCGYLLRDKVALCVWMRARVKAPTGGVHAVVCERVCEWSIIQAMIISYLFRARAAAVAPPLNGWEWMRTSKIIICRVLSKIIITEWRICNRQSATRQGIFKLAALSFRPPPSGIYITRPSAAAVVPGALSNLGLCWASKLIKAQWTNPFNWALSLCAAVTKQSKTFQLIQPNSFW